jgi:3-oxoacyl-[acyl-carrier-protein] synthase-1
VKEVFASYSNIISPLGFSLKENYDNLMQGRSSVCPAGDYETGYRSVFNEQQRNTLSINTPQGFSVFENLMLQCILGSGIPMDLLNSKETMFVFATTKGNIKKIDDSTDSMVNPSLYSLHGSAVRILRHLGSNENPVVISNACTSGVVAMIYATRILASGKFKHAVVCGADTFSDFVQSGFQVLQAVSLRGCKPFSSNRDGIALGEAAATILLTTSTEHASSHRVAVSNGSITNDANHISAPSRTGDELAYAIRTSLKKSGLSQNQMAFANAHGTGTLYNDEMEAKAFAKSEMLHIPISSFKGAVGHTLGAAGLVESILCVMAMQNGMIPPTAGFDGEPLMEGLFIDNSCRKKEVSAGFIKTASGFGGCNAALVFKNVN